VVAALSSNHPMYRQTGLSISSESPKACEPMAELTFCNVENRPFASNHFFTMDNGVTIHVLSATHGHTLDGWEATFKGTQEDGCWKLEHIKIQKSQLQELDMQKFAEGSA
jgi:hypothetical protein